VTATGSWPLYRFGYQFTGSEALDEAYVPFFGAFGAAWDDAMVAGWSANPLGMLWPERDAAFVTTGGGGSPAAARRPVVNRWRGQAGVQGSGSMDRGHPVCRVLSPSSTAAATGTSDTSGIYRWGRGFSSSQDFNGDIALIACFASSWTSPWCGAGTPIRSASCARGTRCLRSLAGRHPPLHRHRRGHLPDGVASNGHCLSKLARDRLQGLHPDLVRVVERAIQFTIQDFRVQEGLCTRERYRRPLQRPSRRVHINAWSA
jgi:hypothetical protein